MCESVEKISLESVLHRVLERRDCTERSACGANPSAASQTAVLAPSPQVTCGRPQLPCGWVGAPGSRRFGQRRSTREPGAPVHRESTPEARGASGAANATRPTTEASPPAPSNPAQALASLRSDTARDSRGSALHRARCRLCWGFVGSTLARTPRGSLERAWPAAARASTPGLGRSPSRLRPRRYLVARSSARSADDLVRSEVARATDVPAGALARHQRSGRARARACRLPDHEQRGAARAPRAWRSEKTSPDVGTGDIGT